MIHDFVNVGGGHCIAGRRIVMIGPVNTGAAAKIRNRYRKLGRLWSFTSGEKYKSMILLDNEMLIVSNLSPKLIVMAATNDKSTREKLKLMMRIPDQEMPRRLLDDLHLPLTKKEERDL